MKYKFIIYGIVIIASVALYATFNDNSNLYSKCGKQNEIDKQLNQAAQGELAAFQSFEKPIEMPDIQYYDENGREMNLRQKYGKTILLNLWATWCAPCREEMPSLNALAQKRDNEKFEVLPISIDRGEISKITEFYKMLELDNLAVAHDPSLNTLNALKKLGLAFGLPATILIDENGCAVGAINGPAHWDSQTAHNIINVMTN